MRKIGLGGGRFFREKTFSPSSKEMSFFAKIHTLFERTFGKGSGSILEKAGVAKLFKGVRQS